MRWRYILIFLSSSSFTSRIDWVGFDNGRGTSLETCSCCSHSASGHRQRSCTLAQLGQRICCICVYNWSDRIGRYFGRYDSGTSESSSLSFYEYSMIRSDAVGSMESSNDFTSPEGSNCIQYEDAMINRTVSSIVTSVLEWMLQSRYDFIQ